MPALDQWEQRLKPYFINRQIRIIGEIPLTRAEVEDMLAGVRACIQRNGIGQATDLLTKRYPHLFLTLLAGFAAQNTEQSFWIALGQRLNISHNYLFNYRWHYVFMKWVKRYQLRYFDSEDAANPFVTTIRFHGGIPAYSLPDFFERLLLPTIKRPELNEIPTRQAMEAVLKTAYFVDSPVINFLEYSGSLGIEFFDACRKLARHYFRTNGDLLPASDLNLPDYVVEAFATFMERTEEEGQTLRLRKPVLGVNPFGDLDRVWLKLPEQEIEMRYAAGFLEWHITWPGLQSPIVVACQLLRRRQNTLIQEDFFPIEATPSHVSVSLVYCENRREELLRRWTLPLVPSEDHTPLLAFRADGGEQVRPNQALPAEYLILIYPHDAQLSIEGQGRQSEIYGRMSGAWRNWQIHEWDLTEAWSIEVIQGDRALGPIISVAGRIPEPELSGGVLSEFGDAETPLYLGEPPSIKIPLRAGSQDELGKWQIKLISVWNTNPPINFYGSIQQFTDQVLLEEDESGTPTAYFPLDCLLGKEPAGTYQLQVFGSGNVHKVFRLRLWPRILPLNLPKQLLPADTNSAPLKFILRLPQNASCEVQAGAGDILVQESMTVWEVTVGADIVEANLNLIWQSPGSPTVRVPVKIPIPRVRWALALDSNQGNLQWSGTPLQKSAIALLQSETAAIHVQAYGLGRMQNRLRLELVEADESERVMQEAVFQKTAFSPDWLRVSLAQFNGTLHHAIQQGRFDLVLQPGRNEPGMHLPLLLAPRSLDIRDVKLIQIDQITWKLIWKEDHPLKNRRFLIVPAWQPWQEPWEYKVPDEAHGIFYLENVALPRTRYLVYFYTAASGKVARTAPPPDISPHMVDLCTPEQRLAMLERQSTGTNEEKFRTFVEKVCILDDAKNLGERDKALSNTLVPFNNLTNLRLMLSLLEWLDKHGIESPYQKFLWRSIFRPEKVKELLHLYKPEDPLLQRYLKHAARVIDIDENSALLIAERSDDPVIINTCLKRLLEREKAVLPLLLLDMIEKARLSNHDAEHILSQKPRWSLENLLKQEPTPQVNRLIAGLLPRTIEKINFQSDELTELILRALPYEPNSSLRAKYLELLMLNRVEEAIQLVFQSLQEGTLPQEEVERLIAIAPDHAFQVLGKFPDMPLYEKWIDWFVENFPGSAGVIRAGVKIQTPVGVGVVDRIEDLMGKSIPQTLLSDHDAQINLLIGDGADRFRVWLNLNDNTLTYFEAEQVWQCVNCTFIHPDRRAIDRHYTQAHPYARRLYRGLPAQMPVNRAELKIVVL